MQMNDAAGYPVSGATPESTLAFERAQHELRCFIDDPLATVDRALAASWSMTLAHVLKAYMYLLSTEAPALPIVRACLDAAASLPANPREQAHLQAARRLADGGWRDAGRILEDLSAEYPRDALALQVGHQIDFFTGDSRMLRDRIARALPHWSRSVPGYHAVIGMHAFGLEETGDYAQAERQGRLSVELEPRDCWGQHAVAHVMEMTNRPRDGIAWMRANLEDWSHDSALAVHNWWHLALYHLELDQVDEVLALFDGAIYGKRSTLVLEMIDASAMLWRLHLHGIELGGRWEALADNWMPHATSGNYAFNDLHAAIAFVGSRRPGPLQALLETQRAAMAGNGDNVSFTREVGHSATLAIQAFGDGDYERTIELLRPLRSRAHRFGGSHAQRDLLDLTLIEASFRAGNAQLAGALVAERASLRPHSPITEAFVRRSMGLAQAA
jgi:hypothetical protein